MGMKMKIIEEDEENIRRWGWRWERGRDRVSVEYIGIGVLKKGGND